MDNVFPFTESDDIENLTELDISRAEEDLDFMFPHLLARRMENVALLSHHPFGHLETLPSDVISGAQSKRTSFWDYSNYLMTESVIAIKEEEPCFHSLPNLERLFTLPAELLFSILELLHPIDLHHLSRSSSSLRQFLWSKQARLLWKTSFDRPHEFPDCPPDFIEPRWATFLYFDSCHVCNSKVSLPEWYIRRRLCQRCLEEHTVDAPRGGGLVYSMIPNTFETGRYWKADITSTQQRLDMFQERINANVLGADADLELYRVAQVAMVMMLCEHANTCHSWREALRDSLSYRADTRRDYCAARVTKLLIRYGVHPEDAEYAANPIDITDKIGQRYLTRKQFEFIRPTFEDRIRSSKASRLLREHQRAIDDRIEAIQGEYQEFTRGVPAWRWAYQPHHDHITTTFQEFHPLIHAPGSDPIPHDKMREAFKEFPALIDRWTHEQMLKLAALADKDNLQDLELATLVFTCYCVDYDRDFNQQHHCMIGWDEAGEHICCCNIFLSTPGFQAAESLVRLVGLDPGDTTATTMDKIDARFFCACCPMQSSRGNLGRGAMNWRDAVFHHMRECNDPEYGMNPLHEVPVWFLLTEAATKEVRNREGSDASHTSDQWACCHCGRNWLTHDEDRPTVRKHLQEVHDMQRPVDGLDLVLYEKHKRPRNKLVFLSEPSYTCSICFYRGRLYNQKQFDNHKQSHGSSPDEFQGIEVKVIEAATFIAPSNDLEIPQDG